MPNPYSEDQLIEQTAIKLFAELWGENNFINAFSEEGERKLGRKNQGEVVLVKYLKEKLIDLNKGVSIDTIDQAIGILTEDKSTKSLEEANKEVYEMLKNGIKVNFQNKKGGFEDINIKVIDWENPENNNFLLVNQMWITGDLYSRRPDLIGFVNGIPLIFIELKGAHKNLKDAFINNIRDYKDTIPQIFWYNAFIIISNGLDSKIGTISSGFEHFANWKKISNEEEKGKVSLETLIKGTCEKTRLLDIVENFIVFDTSKGKMIKIIGKYHQFFGVNKAIERVKTREQNKGKIGVFWHTQGSGKSFSMVFFSQKVMRKLPGNFTFVVVTDRTELDNQIYKQFVNVGAIKKQETQANSIDNLKELLKGDNRYIFTLIHKFQFKDGEIPGPINTRNDIIIITDEAHRSQYDTLAMNMRMSLPNACFIGFTGTPLIDKEQEKTKEVFGNYVSIYNFSQSVEDGATVPIYYENRVPKLENINEDLEKDLEKIMEKFELGEDEEDKLENEFSTAYQILTREDRLESVGEDIVNHFMGRGNEGKAMVVCIDKKTTVRVYFKVKKYFGVYKAKLESDLERMLLDGEKEEIKKKIKFIENLDMAVVISLGKNQNEIDDFRQIGIDFKPIRKRLLEMDGDSPKLEKEFKDQNSNLKIAFVCNMWLTGFDVPNMTTLYLDKPMKNHTLMQTIARVNRVFEEKTNGLIVDYIGIFNNLRKALSIYASGNNGEVGEIVKEKGELIELLKTSIFDIKVFFKKINLDFDDIKNNHGLDKLKIIEDFVDTILQNDEIRNEFNKLSISCKGYYKAILPDPKAYEFQETYQAIVVLTERIQTIITDKADITDVKRELEELMNKSIEAEKFKIETRFDLKDLSKIDFDALKDYFSKNRKNIQMESLKNAIEDKIKDMVKKNKSRLHFIDKLNKILEDYNSGSKDINMAFNDLLELVKLINEEDKRGIAENLTEEELAVFDLLYKENLEPNDEKQIKKIAKELLEKLKQEKLVLDWRKKQDTRADVETTIQNHLFYNLPRSYDEGLCKIKTHQVYLHVYDTYYGEGKSVYQVEKENLVYA